MSLANLKRVDSRSIPGLWIQGDDAMAEIGFHDAIIRRTSHPAILQLYHTLVRQADGTLTSDEYSANCHGALAGAKHATTLFDHMQCEKQGEETTLNQIVQMSDGDPFAIQWVLQLRYNQTLLQRPHHSALVAASLENDAVLLQKDGKNKAAFDITTLRLQNELDTSVYEDMTHSNLILTHYPL